MEDRYIFESDNLIVEGNDAYYYAKYFFQIVHISICNGEMELIPIPRYYRRFFMPFRIIAKEGTNLYLLPSYCKSLCIYDLQRKSFTEVDLSSFYNEFDKAGVTCSIIHERWIYMYGCNLVMIKYHIDLQVVIKIDMREIGNYGFNISDKRFFTNSVQDINGFLFHPINGKLMIAKINLETDELEIRELKDAVLGDYYVVLGWVKDDLWFISVHIGGISSLIKWNYRNGESEEYRMKDIQKTDYASQFKVAGIYGSKIYLLPAAFNCAYIFDSEKKNFILVEAEQVSWNMIRNEEHFLYIFFAGAVENDILYSINQLTGELMEWNMENQEQKIVKLMIPDLSKGKYSKYLAPVFLDTEGVISERTFPGGIRGYIGMI